MMYSIVSLRKAILLVGAYILLTTAENIPSPIPPITNKLPHLDPFPNAPFLQPVSSSWIPPQNFSSNDSSNPLQVRDIIGTDDRESWTSTTFPYSTMGRLESLTLDKNGKPLSLSLCTATLVGPRHVATAAHCVKKPAGTLSKVRFQPSYDECENSSSRGAFASYIYATAFALGGSNCASFSDVAILVLEDRLGDKLGFLDVGVVEAADVKQPVFNSFGYPKDRGEGERPVRQQGISVVNPPGLCGVGNPVITNADVGLGMSGGPLWKIAGGGKPVMVAVLSTSVKGAGLKVTAFSGGGMLVDYVKKMRSEYT